MYSWFTVNPLLRPPGGGGGIEFPSGSETWSYFQFFSARTHIFLPKTFPRIIRVTIKACYVVKSVFPWPFTPELVVTLDLVRQIPTRHRRWCFAVVKSRHWSHRNYAKVKLKVKSKLAERMQPVKNVHFNFLLWGWGLSGYKCLVQLKRIAWIVFPWGMTCPQRNLG